MLRADRLGGGVEVLDLVKCSAAAAQVIVVGTGQPQGLVAYRQVGSRRVAAGAFAYFPAGLAGQRQRFERAAGSRGFFGPGLLAGVLAACVPLRTRRAVSGIVRAIGECRICRLLPAGLPRRIRLPVWPV